MNWEEKSRINKTIELYSGSGWKSIFSKIRFWDAPFVELEDVIPKKGEILDIGCGEGIFTNYLAICSQERNILGIDIDKKRITDAKMASRKLSNVKYIKGDATKVKLPKMDVITIIHVLHHLHSYGQQENLIKECKKKLDKGGKLIIVEVEPGLNFKYLVTWLTDHFIVPILFERRFYSPIYFRSGRQWRDVVEKNGFSCRIINAQKGHPFTHIILECQKK